MAKKASNTATIGFDYVINDEEARAKMQAYFSFIVKQIDSVNKAWAQADKQFSKEPPQRKAPKPPDHGPEINAAEQAAKRIEAVDKRQHEIRAAYSHRTREELLKDRYAIEEKHKILSVAMAEESNKEAKEEIKAQLSVLTERKRIVSQMAAEKAPTLQQSVSHGVSDAMAHGEHGGHGLNLKHSFKEAGDEIAGEIPGIGKLIPMLTNPTALAATALGGLAVGLFEIGEKFHEAEKIISVGTGETGEHLHHLTETYKESLNEVAGSTAGVAQYLADLHTRLDATGEPLKKMTVQFQQLENMGKKTSVEGFSQSIKAFNISAEEAPGVLDKLFAISQKTGVGMDDLTAKIKSTGPALKNMGFSYDESAVLIANATKAGVNTDAMLAGLKKAAVNFTQANVPMKEGLNSTVEAIKNAKTPIEANTIAMSVFGKKAGLELATSIREGKFAVNDLMGSLKSTDAIGETAKETETLGDKISRMTNNVMTAVEPIAIWLVGAIGSLVDWIIEGVKWVIEISKVVGSFIADAIQPLIEWIKGVISRWNEFVEVMKEKLFPVIKAVAGAIFNFYEFQLKVLWAIIKAVLGAIIDWIVDGWNDLITVLGFVWKIIKTVIGVIADIYSWIFKVIGAVVEWVTHFLGLGKVFDTVKGWLGSFVDGIKSAVQWIIDLVNAAKKLLGIGGDDSTIHVKAEVHGEGGHGEGGHGEGEGEKPDISSVHDTGGEEGEDGVDISGVGKKGKKGPKEKKEKPKTAEQIAKELFANELEAIKLASDKEQVANELKYQRGLETKEQYEEEKSKLDIQFNKDAEAKARAHGNFLLLEADKYQIAYLGIMRQAKEAKDKELEKEHEEEQKKLKGFADDNLKNYQHRIDEVNKEEEAMQKARLDVMEDGVEKMLEVERQRYEKEQEVAKGNHDYEVVVEAKHAKNVADIKEKEIQKSNLTYKAGMALMGGVVDKGLDFIDAGWKRSFHNQKTALFEGLSLMSGAIKSSLAGILKDLASKAVTFIAENLAVAGSFIATAIAAAFAWMWSVSPFLAIGAGAGIVFGILSQWKNIKKTLGFAQGAIFTSPVFAPMGNGNTGVIGEAGAEVAAPLKALPGLLLPLMLPLMGTLVNSAQVNTMSKELSGKFDELKMAYKEHRTLVQDARGNILAEEQHWADRDGRRAE